MKTFVFDMDGTLVDFYGVPGWLEKIRREDVSPYLDAVPLMDVDTFKRLLIANQLAGNRNVIVSWLAKDSSYEFKKATRRAKLESLDAMGIIDLFDKIHLVQYGTPKHRLVPDACPQILFDDNSDVCQSWQKNRGLAVNVTKEDMLTVMKECLK